MVVTGVITRSSSLTLKLVPCVQRGRWLQHWEGQLQPSGDRSPSTPAPPALVQSTPGRPNGLQPPRSPFPLQVVPGREKNRPNNSGQGMVFEGERCKAWARGPPGVAACLMCPSRRERSRWPWGEAPGSKASMGSMDRKREPPTCPPPQAAMLILRRSEKAHRRQLVPVSLLEKQLFPKLLNRTPLCLGKGTCK